MVGSAAIDGAIVLFRASSHEGAEPALATLLEHHAVPLVRRIVRRRLGPACSEAEDVCAHVTLQLMVRLRRERGEADLAAIDAFASYVATAAHHGCDHFLRGKSPLLWDLRSRIRYVLEHDTRFGVWKSAGGPWACGRAEWRRYPLLALRTALPPFHAPAQDVTALLSGLFALSAAPLQLNTVVDLAASLWGVPRHRDSVGDGMDTIPDGQPGVDARLVQRARLGGLWMEIGELPLRQRHALLLNLRDDAAALFVSAGVATFDDVAAALELPLATFAALWHELPLPDNAIAERLGCTRQQVINLRQAARKRLVNRLGGSQYPSPTGL